MRYSIFGFLKTRWCPEKAQGRRASQHGSELLARQSGSEVGCRWSEALEIPKQILVISRKSRVPEIFEQSCSSGSQKAGGSDSAATLEWHHAAWFWFTAVSKQVHHSYLRCTEIFYCSSPKYNRHGCRIYLHFSWLNCHCRQCSVAFWLRIHNKGLGLWGGKGAEAEGGRRPYPWRKNCRQHTWGLLRFSDWFRGLVHQPEPTIWSEDHRNDWWYDQHWDVWVGHKSSENRAFVLEMAMKQWGKTEVLHRVALAKKMSHTHLPIFLGGVNIHPNMCSAWSPFWWRWWRKYQEPWNKQQTFDLTEGSTGTSHKIDGEKDWCSVKCSLKSIHKNTEIPALHSHFSDPKHLPFRS